MKSFHEERVEDLPHEVQGVPFDVDEGEEKVDNLLGRKLDEFVFL